MARIGVSAPESWWRTTKLAPESGRSKLATRVARSLGTLASGAYRVKRWVTRLRPLERLSSARSQLRAGFRFIDVFANLLLNIFI